MTAVLPDIKWTIRLATMDLMVTAEVLWSNCYRLEGAFEDGDTVLDVGAHIGAFAAACLARGAGHVKCVEPHPGNARLLRKNLSAFPRSRWSLETCALWRQGEREVRLQGDGPGTAMYHVLRPGQPGGLTVRAKTLDELLPDGPVHLVKLDCEGAEWPALYESERLREVREVLVELHPMAAVPGYECSAGAACERLRRLGLEPHAWPQEGHPHGNLYVRARR